MNLEKFSLSKEAMDLKEKTKEELIRELENLRKRETILKNVVENSTDLFCLFNKEGILTSANKFHR